MTFKCLVIVHTDAKFKLLNLSVSFLCFQHHQTEHPPFWQQMGVEIVIPQDLLLRCLLF